MVITSLECPVLFIFIEGVLDICRSLSCWGFVLGLLGFISSRIWFTSFVPAWWSNWSNTVVIAISAVATVDKIFSGARLFVVSNTVICFAFFNRDHFILFQIAAVVQWIT